MILSHDLEQYIGKRVCITGGRKNHDQLWIERILTHLKPALLIHGDCPTGADHYADLWARETHTPVIRYPAEWIEHGHAAGPIRNAFMLKDSKPDVLIAFHGHHGTAHAIEIARELGIPVVQTVPMP